MTQVLSIIGALLLFGVIVLVHELGHYTTGRLLGIGIEEFSIGFGPKLFGWKRKEIQYSLRAVPLGGFVLFVGEDKAEERPDALPKQKPLKRLIVLFAGAFMNVVLAVALAMVLLGVYGMATPRIASVEPGKPAALAGMQAGDEVVGVNGKGFGFAQEFLDELATTKDSSITLNVRRDGEAVDVHLRDIYDEEAGRNLIGVTVDSAGEPRKVGVFGAIGYGFKMCGMMLMEMYRTLGSLFTTPDVASQVVGPVGIITMMGEAVQYGFADVASLVMLISLNLAVVNLLPIPGLDGMRMVFTVIEMIRGKPIPPEKEGWIHAAGLVLLLVLAVFITVGDVRRLFGGG